MTLEEFQEKLKSIPTTELIEVGNIELSKLCKTGGKSFVMTIPPRLHDTDMLFSEILRRLEEYHNEWLKNLLPD